MIAIFFRFGPLFPPDWEMSERMTAEFCRVTRTDLIKIMKNRQAEVDTKLLLHAIQKTAAFESLLSRRFTGVTLNISRNIEQNIVQTDPTVSNNPFGDPDNSSNNPFGDPDASTNPFDTNDTDTSDNSEKQTVSVRNYQSINLTPFKGIISQCFEPYLFIYLEAQDKNLSEMISRFSSDLSSSSVVKLEPGEGAPVLTSCGDLFVFYRKCLVQLAELTTGQPMLDLAGLFKKYLREYTSKVIMTGLPKIGNNVEKISDRLPAAMTQLSGLKDLSGLSQATTGLLSNFSSLLKEGEIVRFSASDQVIIMNLKYFLMKYFSSSSGGDMQLSGDSGVLSGHHDTAGAEDEAEGGH